MTFAEKLRKLRADAGLTQEALAEASGIPIWTVRNYEQGRREPNWKAAIQLARGLGVAVEMFAACESREEEKPVKKPGGRRRQELATSQGEGVESAPKKPRGKVKRSEH